MQQWSVLQKRLIWCLECLFYKNLTRDNIPKEVIFKLVIVRNLLDKTHILTRTIMNDILLPVLLTQHSVQQGHGPSLKLLYSSLWLISMEITHIGVKDKSGDICSKNLFWRPFLLLPDCLISGEAFIHCTKNIWGY